MSVLSPGMLVFGYVLSFLAGAAVCLAGAGLWRRFGAAGAEAAGEQARRTPEADRLRGVSQSLPGIEFQYRVDPGGAGRYRFVGARAEALLGLSPDADDFEEQFLARVPEAYRDRHDHCVRAARSGARPEQVELPFDRPDGERVWLLLTSVLERRPEAGGEALVFNGFMLDITERKEQEHTLRILSEAVEQTTDGVVVTEAPGRDDAGEADGGTIAYVNRAFEEMTGYAEEELIGRTPQLLRGPETDPDVIASLEQALAAQEPWTGETVNYRKDGTRYSARWTTTPMFDEAGALQYWVSIQRDVTEKQERQNDLFERAQEIADVGAWEYDVEADTVRWTENARRMMALPARPSDSLDEALRTCHPDDRPTVRAAVEDAVEEGTPFDLKARLIAPDGERRWVHARGEPQSEDGTVVRVRGTIQDITDRRRRQEALRTSKSQYQTLVDNFPDGAVFLFDEDLTFRTAGGQGLADVGLSTDEVVGRTLHDLFPEDIADRQVEYYRRALDGEKSVLEEQYQGGDYRVQVLPVRDEDGTVIAGMAVSRDVTDEKERERALRGRRDKVEALYETADRLLTARSTDEIATVLVEIIREALGHQGVSVRFAREGVLEVAHVAEATREFMPERPPFDVDGDSAVAEVYRSGDTLTISDLQATEVEDPHDYGALRSVVVVPMGAHGTFAVASPDPGAISEFDIRLIEVLGTYATAVLDRLDRENRLREERDLLDQLLSTSPAAIVLLDEAGNFVRVNERAKEVLGIERSEVTERAFDDPEWGITTVDGRPIPDADLPFRRVLRNQEPVFGYEHAIEWPDGTRRILSVSGAPLQDVEGTAQGALFHLNDITERTEQKQALRRRTEKIEALYEATRRLLRAGSREAVAAEVHGVLQDVFAYPFRHTAFVEAGEIIPKKTTAEGDADLPAPSPQPVDGDTVAARTLKAGEAVVVPDTAALENGIDYGDLRAAAGVPIGRRGVIIAGTSDEGDFDRLNLRLLEVLGGYAALVLERLRREEELRGAKDRAEAARADAEQARDDARKAARLKSAFLANMSHEIRTPLTSIIGFAEVLGAEVGALDASAAGSLEQKAHLIEQGGKRLLDTLEGVLNLSKLEAGQMELDRRPVDLADRARRTAEELKPKATDKGVRLQVETGTGPVRARADEGGVQIVVQNLLSNAIKYTNEGGRVRVRTYREDGAAVLEVEDTGIGMEPEAAKELFEPFRQASEGIGRKYEGSGVGLAVTQKATEEMDGDIEVDTEKGDGSRFVVRLPRAESAADAEA
ncbi:PAS domain S-box-containing protein [Salinibacter ruber]|uniref:histidine kinase n=1 Tax=Salinibacter ruber TaxID=146919 RepID=A0A9X2TJR0_9BACT|nr:PAS domain S-box protein [Salinibacter ruber]MCS3638539.1 PAS domain S-box-containing protein [Salinibacter ruber]MCS3660867.1 PAS domain S-box-containing protein [Salinibacter ruber]MCS3669738.1 PAS domain S-box-containing protein [Salinibacter ruber]MCS3710789.1 PAS domain S-box-containing protein [Salinibacter ruber]MCS4098914.1 PAS domain S-box-containing protein [Salinibacter ruber]